MKADLQAANARLKKLSESDGLTGLANRRLFDVELATAWQRVAATGAQLCLILIDIDHFKQFNDAYGHLRGDDCLKRVARVLESAAASHGSIVVARDGGEEFAVLIDVVDLASALPVGEVLRQQVQAEALTHAQSSTAPVVTVSVGVCAMRPNPGDPPTRLFDAADQALYRAKQGGRNRVSS